MTSPWRTGSWLLLVALLVPAGCGSEAAPADSGSPADSGAESDGGSRTVEVIYQTKSTPVDLGKPAPVSLEGSSYARLSEVVLLALPGKNLELLLVDFEAGDGFKPSKNVNCATLFPLAGSTLPKGYVNLQSGNVRWEDSLAYPGCAGVKNLAKILVSDK